MMDSGVPPRSASRRPQLLGGPSAAISGAESRSPRAVQPQDDPNPMADPGGSMEAGPFQSRRGQP